MKIGIKIKMEGEESEIAGTTVCLNIPVHLYSFEWHFYLSKYI